MKLYRITKEKYARDLRGTGGLYEAGRWHREGTPIAYTSETVSLAMLEVLGHWNKAPVGLVLVTIEIPENASVCMVDADRLPDGWRDIPYLPALAELTEGWLNTAAQWLMRVPSAHYPGEFNVLLNPLHPEHQRLKIISIEPHPFDPRLK